MQVIKLSGRIKQLGIGIPESIEDMPRKLLIGLSHP